MQATKTGVVPSIGGCYAAGQSARAWAMKQSTKRSRRADSVTSTGHKAPQVSVECPRRGAIVRPHKQVAPRATNSRSESHAIEATGVAQPLEAVSRSLQDQEVSR